MVAAEIQHQAFSLWPVADDQLGQAVGTGMPAETGETGPKARTEQMSAIVSGPRVGDSAVSEPTTQGSTPAILQARTRTPRILYLSPYWPHRATCASELRALHIARALQEFGHVEVVVVDAEGGADEWAARKHHELSVAYSVPVRPRPQKSLREKAEWAISPNVTYPLGACVDEDAARRVIRKSKDFDLTWFCKLRTADLFPRGAWPRSVADVDDIPSTFEYTMLRASTSMRDRALSLIRYLSWRRRDRLLGERFSVLGVCSEMDKRYLDDLGVTAPLHVIPNGFEAPGGEPLRCPSVPPRLGFIGIFDYEPNLDGIRWFADKCWPLVLREIPDARLRLVGRHSNGPHKPSGTNIDGLGFVENATDEISTWAAMVVPVRIGAGTRGKIAHAFSVKCPIVSTSLGAYGYEATNGDTMLLADTAEGFARACIDAVRQPERARAMADRAWEQFQAKWAWDAIRPRVWAAAEDCLRRNAATSASGI